MAPDAFVPLFACLGVGWQPLRKGLKGRADRFGGSKRAAGAPNRACDRPFWRIREEIGQRRCRCRWIGVDARNPKDYTHASTNRCDPFRVRRVARRTYLKPDFREGLRDPDQTRFALTIDNRAARTGNRSSACFEVPPLPLTGKAAVNLVSCCSFPHARRSPAAALDRVGPDSRIASATRHGDANK